MKTLTPRWVHAILALLLVVSSSAAPLSETKPTQYDVEAAYLFNFGKFVTWPANSGGTGPFRICILGNDPFGPVLDNTVAGETLHGKEVENKRISRPQDAIGCSILYISRSEAGHLGNILPLLKDSPVLTVSDMPDFAQHGGIIQFVLQEGRVRFVVNLEATQTDGLTLSSELLKVALDVRQPKGGR